MNIDKLIPRPTSFETFKRSRCSYVPECSGCYVLTTFSKLVLYVGLATNLRTRMNQHLDDPEKTGETAFGRAVLFHWIEVDEVNLNRVERTWINIHCLEDGKNPVLNKIYSPVSV
jgi:excinuclease UvrABC nuclease subunit